MPSEVKTRRVALIVNAHRYQNPAGRPAVLKSQFRQFLTAGIHQALIPVPAQDKSQIEREIPSGLDISVQCVPVESNIGSVLEATQAVLNYQASIKKPQNQKTFFMVADARLFLQANLEPALTAHGRASHGGVRAATLISFRSCERLESAYGATCDPVKNPSGLYPAQKAPFNLGQIFRGADILLKIGFFVLPDSFFVEGLKSGEILGPINHFNFDHLWSVLGNPPGIIEASQNEEVVRRSLALNAGGQRPGDLLKDLIDWRKSCLSFFYPLNNGGVSDWETGPEPQ